MIGLNAIADRRFRWVIDAPVRQIGLNVKLWRADDDFIAVGANLPGPGGETPLQECQAAVAAVARLEGLSLHAVSRWYESAPVPPSGQPRYVNGVASFDGSADPGWLLARLHEIEAGAGRVRSGRNAARTLDLDIIAMGALVRDAPDPVLPHPRAQGRAFVLVPLADVAPDWTHPRLHRGIGMLIADLAPAERADLVAL